MRGGNLFFDHIAISVGIKTGSLEKYVRIFENLGFKKEWHRKKIGNSETAMKTAVIARGGAKFALMEGVDGRSKNGKKIISQVSAYYKKFGLSVQHIAIRCDDLKSLVDDWSKKGVRFLTEDESGRPKILADEENGSTVLQCFTYPIEKTFFLELKQVFKKSDLPKIEEFRDSNVKGLWASLDRAKKEGWLFKTNIFGEKK